MSQPTDDLIAQLKALTPPPPARTALDAAFAAGQRSRRSTIRYWQGAAVIITLAALLPTRSTPPQPSTPSAPILATALRPTADAPSPESVYLLTRTMDLSLPTPSARRSSNPSLSPRAFDPAS